MTSIIVKPLPHYKHAKKIRVYRHVITHAFGVMQSNSVYVQTNLTTVTPTITHAKCL